MSSTIIKKIEIQHPTANIEVDIGAEAQSITVSRNANGEIITDLETEIVDSTETLAETLKEEESPFTGATASANGTKGLVPQPVAGDENKCLFGDATWRESISGSSITITSLEASLSGKQVSISDGIHTKTGTFDSSGICTITGITFVGNLTTTSTDGTETATKIVNMPYFGVYSTTLSFWAATVNITGSDELKGALVTVKNSSDVTVGTVTLSSTDATGVFVASEADTYKFNFTYGGKNYSEELEITAQTTYNLSLSVGFDWQTWLDEGRVSKSFSSLDDILEDEETLRQLMLVHDSVDYLASQNVDESVEKVFNTDLAAKWINNSDYALDKFYAVADIKTVMDEADKYGYGEWCLMPQVPKMTSNTAPSGEASASSVYSSQAAYLAFDGNDSTYWASNVSNSGDIIYKFTKSTVIKQIGIRPRVVSGNACAKDCTLLGSNDGTTYESIDTFVVENSDTLQRFSINNNNSYLYYKVSISSVYGTSNYNASLCTLQFYAYAPKGNVPVMTANNAPYGEVISDYLCSSSGIESYKAFDGDDSTRGAFGNTTNSNYLGYKFVNPVNVRRIKVGNDSNSRIQKFKIQYSDDNSTWSDATNEQTFVENTTISITDYGYHIYWRLFVTVASDYPNNLNTLQFYGRELKVSVPTMTSNTAQIVSNGQYGDDYPGDVYQHPQYRAFDNNNDSYWMSRKGPGDRYIGYDFKKPVLLQKVIMYKVFGNAQNTCEVKGSNDGGNTWESIKSFTGSTNGWVYLDVTPSKAYKQYIISANILNSSGTYYALYAFSLQFYGLDYSEKEFEVGTTKKWLYDHGVLLSNATFEATDYRASGATDQNTGYRLTPTVTYESNNVVVYEPDKATNQIGIGNLYVSQSQNLTGYTMAFIRTNAARIYRNGNSWQGISLVITSNKQEQYTNVANAYIVIQGGTASADVSTGHKIVSLDITSVTGNNYIMIYLGSIGRIDFSELWLE